MSLTVTNCAMEEAVTDMSLTCCAFRVQHSWINQLADLFDAGGESAELFALFRSKAQ